MSLSSVATPENVASLPSLEAQSHEHQQSHHDEEDSSSVSSASCSFYDVDDLKPVQLEEL